MGWNCIEPEATSLTMQGLMSPPCRFSCPIAVVPIAWNNCANTQRLGVAEKSRRPVQDFLREKFAKKMPSFLQKYGFENARKNLRPFSQIFGPGPFAGSLSQNLTPCDVFFSLQQSLLSWLCSQNVSPACQHNVLCEKAAKPSKEFWWCRLAWRPSRKQP